MNLQEIKRDIDDFKKKHRRAYSKIVEEEVDGEVKFVDFSIRFKITNNDKKSLDSYK